MRPLGISKIRMKYSLSRPWNFCKYYSNIDTKKAKRAFFFPHLERKIPQEGNS